MGTRLPQSKWDFFSSNRERKEDKNLSLNRQRARITPSSIAEQPPCPISGVIGWSASPATHTLSFAMFAHKSCHGGRYLSRDITMLSRSVVSTTLLMFSGKSLSLFSTNSLRFSGFFSLSNQPSPSKRVSVTAEERMIKYLKGRVSSVYLIQYKCGLGTSRQCWDHRG